MRPWKASRQITFLTAGILVVMTALVAAIFLSALGETKCDREVAAARSSAIPEASQIDTAVRTAMAQWNVPGLALAIVKDGEPFLVKGYGVQDATQEEPITVDTLFGLLSPTKSFTTTALAMLEDEGRLSWEDTVARHIPEFELADPQGTQMLTVLDLVSHGSGFTDRHAFWYRTSLSRDQVVGRAREMKRVSPTGEAFNYNNTMFIVAAELIERVSGQSWDAFIQTRFFEPLGMERSTTSDNALAGRANVASPHVRRFFRRFGSPTPIDYEDVDVIGPAGAIHTSANDMIPWLKLNLEGGTYQGQRMISKEALEMLWKPQVRMPVPAYLCGVTSSASYGLGWFLLDYRGNEMMMHGGGFDGQRSAVGLLPQQQLGIVVLSNMDDTEVAQQLLFSITDMFLDVPPTDWFERFRRQGD